MIVIITDQIFTIFGITHNDNFQNCLGNDVIGQKSLILAH